jgi:hypothetical protein
MEGQVLVDGVSEDEQRLIVALRERILDVEVDTLQRSDIVLIKFLRARNLDLDEAEKMWRASMVWRKEFGVDALAKDFRAQMNGEKPKTPETILLERYMSGRVVGVDKKGGPLYFDRLGPTDVGGVVREVGVDAVLRWMVAVAEDHVNRFYDIARTAEAGHRNLHGVIIADLEGMGMAHLGIASKYSKMTAVLEANYPERMSVCYVVNAPWLFGQVYAIVKPMLSEGTRKKIIVPKNKKETMISLQSHVALENIPTQLGGSLAWPAENTLGPVPQNELQNITKLAQQGHNSDANGAQATDVPSANGAAEPDKEKPVLETAMSKMIKFRNQSSARLIEVGATIRNTFYSDNEKPPQMGMSDLKMEMANANASQANIDYQSDSETDGAKAPSRSAVVAPAGKQKSGFWDRLRRDKAKPVKN